MRRIILLTIVAFLIAVLLPFMASLHKQSEAITTIDVVEVNELLSELADNWDKDFVYPECTFEYTVLDNEEKILFSNASKSSAPKTIVGATGERDTIRDIKKDDTVLGKVIIYNNISDMERNVVYNLYGTYYLSLGISLVIILLLIIWIYFRVLRPFDKMKSFASNVAAGNLDTPMEMDKGNMFGAFTESFDIMREELAIAREREYQANVSKRELVAELSHDIKTPVASIKAMSELLSVKTEDEASKQKLNSISAKADQIDEMVSNLFASTLEELEKLEVNPTELGSDELEEIIRTADYNRKIKNLEIPGCIVFADKLRVVQIINNIIYNSYKYADTVITVESRIEDDTLEICITDKGGGVSEEELSTVTEKYKRGKNAEGKQGTGLGLYISKMLMESMQGSLEVANRDGGFSVTLYFKIV